MAYRKLDQKLWGSVTFRSMSRDARDLYIYLLSCPHNNPLCCFRIGPGYVADDLQWDMEDVKKAMDEVTSTYRPDGTPMVLRDEQTQLTMVYGQLEKEGIPNENCATSCAKVLDTLPTFSTIYAEVLKACERINKPHLEPLIERLQKRLPERLGERLGEQQEQEQGQEQEGRIKPCPDGHDSSPEPAASADIRQQSAVEGEEKPGKKPKQQTPSCPHQEIIALYHEILPELNPVQVWNDTRAGYLRARWREGPERQSLAWWRDYFQRIRGSPFLMGLVDKGPGRKPFQADLEWLVRPQNFAKVIEGRYHDREGARKGKFSEFT